MSDEEKPDGMGLGDRVFSEKWNLEGTIKELTECHHCKAPSITLDDGENGVLGYYHVENFKVIERKN